MVQSSIFIVSAPSGSGKSTLLRRLMTEVPELARSISYTTRAPRGQEQNGKHYFFVSREEFESMIERGELLEWAELYGKDLYGTPRRFLEEARQRNHDLVLDIDVQGAAKIKQQFPKAESIFILPPSRQALEARLRHRSEDSQEAIERRLRRALREIENYPKYDYVIINDEVDRAAEKLRAIVLATRWKRRNDGRPAEPEVRRWFELAEGCRTAGAEPLVAPIRQTFAEAKTE